MISKFCFCECSNLSDLRFESGSRLWSLDDFAFYNCSSLESISLPAFLTEITGLALAVSGLRNVIVDGENFCLQIHGSFVVDDLRSLVRYFGDQADVVIPRDFSCVGKGCFNQCKSVSCVTFESGSEISILGQVAFEQCSSLESVCIPSSVQTISDGCFSHCRKLSQLTFESGSALSILGDSAFSSCFALCSICLPSSLETISAGCFQCCQALLSVTFESGSRIVTIEGYAFALCSSLTSIVIPSSIQAISGDCFSGCENLGSIVLEAGCELSQDRVSDLAQICDVTFQ
jgi:hypothetical protein